MEYIKDHLDCTKLIAHVVDILHGEKRMVLWCVNTNFICMMKRIGTLHATTMFCKPLAEGSTICIILFLQIHYAVVALYHPEFQNRLLLCVDSDSKNKLLQSFKDDVFCDMNLLQRSNEDRKEELLRICLILLTKIWRITLRPHLICKFYISLIIVIVL